MNKIALTPGLDHPAYHFYVTLPRFNGKVTVFRTTLPRDSGRVLKLANPDWSTEDHIDLAKRHEDESQRLEAIHRQLLDTAHMETFGRPRAFEDYRISAIGSDAYPAEMKERLRHAAHTSSYHKRLSWAHAAAGKCRRKLMA